MSSQSVAQASASVFRASLISSSVIADRSHIPRNIPSGASYNLAGVSNSCERSVSKTRARFTPGKRTAISPASRTHIRSYPMIVRSRSVRRGCQCQHAGFRRTKKRGEKRKRHTSDAQDGTIFKLVRDCILDFPVRFIVNRC